MSKHVPKATLLTPSDVAFITDANRPVLTHTRNMAAEAGIEPHSHPRGQLLWAAKGLLRVRRTMPSGWYLQPMRCGSPAIYPIK